MTWLWTSMPQQAEWACARPGSAVRRAGTCGSAMREPRGDDAVLADRLVLFARPAARADGAQHRAARVLDQHRAGLRQEAPVRRRGERDEEVRVVLGTLAEHPAGRPHADRRPRLPGRNVDPEHARAVLALRRL